MSRNSGLRHWLTWPAALGLAVGAALAGGNRTLEYVDDETGATVTVVGQPLVFVYERTGLTDNAGDYVTLAAAAVDQSGKLSYLLVAYFWSAGGPRHSAGEPGAGEPLVLHADDRDIELVPSDRSAREVGIGAPVHRPPFGAPTPYVYTIDLSTLRFIAESRHLALHFQKDERPRSYELLEDRRVALREFARHMNGVNGTD